MLWSFGHSECSGLNIKKHFFLMLQSFMLFFFAANAQIVWVEKMERLGLPENTENGKF